MEFLSFLHIVLKHVLFIFSILGENFPVRVAERRSYSSSSGGAGAGAIWVHPTGLQTDVHKLLRHARKLPDKTHHFYKVCYNCFDVNTFLTFHTQYSIFSNRKLTECGEQPWLWVG